MKKLLVTLLSISFVNLYSQCATPITMSSPSICAGQSVTMFASGAQSYTWTCTWPTPTTIVSPSIVCSPGSDTQWGVVSNLCPVSTQTMISVNTPTITFPNIVNKSICGSTSSTINVLITTGNGISNFSGINYSWSGFTNNSSSISVTNSVTSIYTVTANWFNCASKPFTVAVFVKQTPTLSSQITKTNICSGDYSQLTVSGVNSWTCQSSSSTFTGTWANLNPVTITPSITSIYTITGETGGCFTPPTYSTINVRDCSNTNSINEIGEYEFLIYPNPSNGELFIKSSTPKAITLIDIFGKVVFSKSVQDESINLASGIYFVVSENKIKKVVVN